MSDGNAHHVGMLGTVAFEGPFVPYAGITAVIRQSAAPLASASDVPSVVILPFHHRVINTGDSAQNHIGSVSVPFDADMIDVEIIQVDQCLFLKPSDQRFFAGASHPYDLPGHDLLRDALFFGAAVARGLPVIAAHYGHEGSAWGLICHDWESVTAALALAGEPQHRLLLVLHNVYDGAISGIGLSDHMLRQVGIAAETCPGPPMRESPTVLQRALCLPTLTRSVLAVSDQFAADVCDDIYLAETLAPHLRGELQDRIRGNDNGLFAPLKVPPQALADAARGITRPLQNWKLGGRTDFIAALRKHESSESEPIWGNPDAFIGADAPETIWFVTGGRDDARQRGHDVLAGAVPETLREIPLARFLFFVMPGEEGLEGMRFLKELTERHPEQVLALPFRFVDGYLPALRAANWAVMPSLYGPFESANEFYLLGAAPGIARACGGLIQQIIPLRASRTFSKAVQNRVAGWHAASSHPTGILYRESDDLPTAHDDWKAINEAAYLPHGDRLQQRQHQPLFRAMVRELRMAIADGVHVCQDEKLYYAMIAEGVGYLRRTFSWDRNAEELVRTLLH